MSLTAEQVRQLLKPIAPQRVMRANNHSHLAQQDVTAHLTRIFGFGNWQKTILHESVIIDEKVSWTKDGKPKDGWDVTYRVRMRLTVKDPDGQVIWEGDDGATGSATHQPNRADAHDLAYKAAISYALKRCAKDLGDQFGLSLYNKGQLTPLVRRTLVMPGAKHDGDVQEGVEQQVSDGEHIQEQEQPAASSPGPSQAAPPVDEIQLARSELWAYVQTLGWNTAKTGDQFEKWSKAGDLDAVGINFKDATAEQVRQFLTDLRAEAQAA